MSELEGSCHARFASSFYGSRGDPIGLTLCGSRFYTAGRRYRLGVRTGGSQPSNRGSNPRSATNPSSSPEDGSNPLKSNPVFAVRTKPSRFQRRPSGNRKAWSCARCAGSTSRRFGLACVPHIEHNRLEEVDELRLGAQLRQERHELILHGVAARPESTSGAFVVGVTITPPSRPVTCKRAAAFATADEVLERKSGCCRLWTRIGEERTGSRLGPNTKSLFLVGPAGCRNFSGQRSRSTAPTRCGGFRSGENQDGSRRHGPAAPYPRASGR